MTDRPHFQYTPARQPYSPAPEPRDVRIVFLCTKDEADIIQAEADKQRVPVAQIIRDGLSELFYGSEE